MNKKTKFSKSVNEKVDSSKTYTLDEENNTFPILLLTIHDNEF